MKDSSYIKLKKISLIYDLYYDKTHSVKEYVVNFFHRRKYVEEKVGKLYALDNISLKINHGDRVGIIGLNGAGKSTLLKVITGILKPTLGSIDILGSVQPLIEVAAGFNPEFSGRENIYLNGAMLGFDKKEIRESEEEIIVFSELRDFIDVPVKYYSSGMAVRLAFTIATLIRPEILLVDEMLSAGDISFIKKAKQRMDELLTIAKILIIVSHDLNLISSLTKRTLVMDQGKIVFDGTTEDGINFYREMVEMANKEKDKIKQEKQIIANQKKNLQIMDVNCETGNKSKNAFLPNDDVTFVIDYLIKSDIKYLEISQKIIDYTGIVVANFSNEMAKIDLRNIKKGNYRLNIKVPSIPFRSGTYNYQFKFIEKDKNNVIVEKVEHQIQQFTITGDKKYSEIIKHNWKFMKKNSKTSSMKVIVEKKL
ncbi:polysaccharide ABC transporter ATP-binding protein [Spirochaetota bacterium]